MFGFGMFKIGRKKQQHLRRFVLLAERRSLNAAQFQALKVQLSAVFAEQSETVQETDAALSSKKPRASC